MNGSILLGSRDSTNLRIQETLGENVAVLFGQNYYEMQVKKCKQSDKVLGVIQEIIKGKLFGPIDNLLVEHLKQLQNLEKDSLFI